VEWRPFPGYENYEINAEGDVRSTGFYREAPSFAGREKGEMKWIPGKNLKYSSRGSVNLRNKINGVRKYFKRGQIIAIFKEKYN
jgi:hypothetical protein